MEKEPERCFKQPYESKSAAERSARVLSKKRNRRWNQKRAPMHAYRCPDCGAWHMGH